MRKPKTDPQSVINCGNADDAYLAFLCMFRYAFGRMTYMPSVVIGIIMRNAKNIPYRALMQLNAELAEEAVRYDRAYNDKAECVSNYGMECDRQAWLAFHSWIKEQLKKTEGEKK